MHNMQRLIRWGRIGTDDTEFTMNPLRVRVRDGQMLAPHLLRARYDVRFVDNADLAGTTDVELLVRLDLGAKLEIDGGGAGVDLARPMIDSLEFMDSFDFTTSGAIHAQGHSRLVPYGLTVPFLFVTMSMQGSQNRTRSITMVLDYEWEPISSKEFGVLLLKYAIDFDRSRETKSVPILERASTATGWHTRPPQLPLI